MSAQRHAVLSTNRNLVLTELNGVRWIKKVRGHRSKSGQVGRVIKRDVWSDMRQQGGGVWGIISPLLPMGSADLQGPTELKYPCCMVPVEGSGVSRVLKHGGCSTWWARRGRKSVFRWGEGKGEVSRQMEGSLVALHLMHLFMLCLVSFQSAKGRKPCIHSTDKSLIWFHLPAGMLPSSVKT